MDSLITELEALGIPRELAEEQIRLLELGTRYSRIHRSASVGDGIIRWSEEDVDARVSIYDLRDPKVKVLKFVPASGAASRMFKSLIESRNSGRIDTGTQAFLESIEKAPFYHLLDSDGDHTDLLEQILSEDGLALNALPKGSIPFHRYGEEVRTAFEEHLVEGVDYADSDQKIHIHFTLSAEHMEPVKESMTQWAAYYSEKLSCAYDLQFSVQKPSTDTMPTSIDGEALRGPDGKIKLRPGGHGSLIYNLNALEADIIFIKNVDNVVPDNHRSDTIRYKKALAGLLMEVREEAREIIRDLQNDLEGAREKAEAFAIKVGTELNQELIEEELIKLLNRPYRVCGMVRNQGEPGGGPFWVEENGRRSLQVVESAQIDTGNEFHVDMLQRGTHFNPVDLVCNLNDLYGQKLDLLNHVDMETAFVTYKSIDGVDSKVLEWPGLWNGAMADWNTLFVEVPISTFNPVKTVADLLRPMHQ